MTFERIDWEAEALRVASAFGIEFPCQFLEFDSDQRLLYLQGFTSRIWLRKEGALYLTALYDQKGRLFTVSESYADSAEIFIGWDGSVDRRPWFYDHNLLIARALFYLDLLTPEVEAALLVSVSAHERLEWLLHSRKVLTPSD